MATVQPSASDKLNSPSHSLLHRIIAPDASSPEQSFIVDASGNVSLKSGKNYQIDGVNLNTSNISVSTDKNYLTDAERTKLAGIEVGAEVNNISDVNAADLTDSGDSALHYHSTDRARANHTGTQPASTISDFDTEVSSNSSVALNTSKETNATHTGEVTGSGALVVADNIIDEANLKLDESPTNDYVLTADSSKSGGMKWSETEGTPEGTAIKSTGETGAVKFLREDGDGTSSWQVPVGNVEISGTPIANDFAKFVNGTDIEGRSYSEVKTDLGLNNVVNLDTSNASNITSGTLPSSVLPPVAITKVTVVASEAAQLALTAEEGDIAVRSDENKSYMHNSGSAGTMSDWTELQTPTDAVLSVNGEIGTVILNQDEIGDGSTYVRTHNDLTDVLAGNIVTNNAKETNATHTGEVTGDEALTVADNIIDEANLKVNAPANDQVLTADSGEAGGMKWANNPSGFSDPMTTRGDVIVKDASNVTTRLGIGTNGQALMSDGTDIAWGTPSGGSGDVSKVGTPMDNQIGVWTGDGTIEGTSDFTYDGDTLNLGTTDNIQFGSSANEINRDGQKSNNSLTFQAGTSTDYINFNLGSTTHMKMDDSGNFGIGTLTPATKLDVDGIITANSYLGDGSTLSGIEVKKGNTITVAKSGGDYDTIQAAINASTSGDTILIYDGTYSESVTTKAGAMTTLVGVGTMGSVIIESNSGICLTVPSAMMSMAFIKNLKLKSTATGNNASKLFYGEGTMTTFKDVSFDYNISNGYTEEIIDLEAGSYVFSNCRFDYDSIGTNGGTNNFISASGGVNYNVMQGYGTMSIASISSAEHLHFIGDSSSNDNLIRDFDCTIEATSASYGGHLDFIHSTNAGNIESLGNKIAITTPSGVAGSYGQVYHLAGSGGGHIHSSSNNIEIIGFGNDYIGNINATETLYSHFDDIVAEDNIIGDGTYSYANSPSNGDLQMSGNIIKKLLNITTDYDETESWEFGILSANSSTTDITATLNPTYFAGVPSGATKTFINAGSTHNFILDPNGATWGGSTLPRVIYPGGYIILERIGSEGIIISSHNTSFNIEIADIDNPSFHVDFSDESSVTVDGSSHITQVVDSVNSWNGTPSSAIGVEYGTTTQNGLKTAKWDTSNTPLSFGDNDINNNTAGRGMTIIAVVKANNSNDAIMSKYYDATPQREWRMYTSNITIYNNLDASGNEAIINYSSNYGEWEILQIEWAPGEGATAYKNGFLLGTSSYDVATIPEGTANLLMGASDLVGADFSGEIGEIWAFSDTITKEEREAVTSKLGAKWDIDVATPSSSDSSPFGRNSDTETIKPLIDNDNLDIGTGDFSCGNITPSGTVDGVDIAAEKTRLAGTSGSNTGDQDLSSYATKTGAETLINKTIDGDDNIIQDLAVSSLKDSTDGELITWGTDGVATTISTGADGHILTSKGVGAVPVFEAPSGGGANTALSNLADVQISEDLVFTEDVGDAVLIVEDQTTPGTDGSGFYFQAGEGNTTGDGGRLRLYAGDGGLTGNGGDILFDAGDGGSNGDFDGGDITLSSGLQSGAGSRGIIDLRGFVRITYGVSAIFDLSLLDVTDRTYSFPDASGTLALTSDLAVKATGAEINTGTDDAKFATPKAVADSKISITDGVEILSNKRITKRIGTTTSSATPTINSDNYDMYIITAQAVDITSFTTNLSGTPNSGDKLWIAITGTGARAITWGADFENGAVDLPTTTVTTERLDVGFIWNATTSKWRCMAQG